MENILTETLKASQVIQLMLAPAVMISACGLLLLGINNKYSLVVNRIRLLNEERRKYKKIIGGENTDTEENIRFESIVEQLDLLAYRVKLVRNSVLCYTMAVALFVITSLLLGFSFFNSTINLNFLTVLTFLSGMIFVLAGVIFAGLETKKGYDIIEFEIKADE